MTEIRPLRAYAEVALGRQRSPQHDQGPYMVPYLRAANVKDGRLFLDDVKEMNFDPKEQSVFALRPGDVLVTEGSGSLSAVGASAVWNGELDGTVCFQNTLLRLRPRLAADGRFLAWWCRYAFADGLFAAMATGANIFHVSAERVRSLPMNYIPLAKQRAIADFLDTETARLDALITKKRRMADLFDERLRVAIDQWISASCRVPLKRLVRYQEGPGIMAADFIDDGVPLIRVAGVGGDYVTLQGCNYLDQAAVSERWSHFALEFGDYLISASASMGTVSKVGHEAVGAIPYTGLIRFKPAVNDIDMEFVRYFLSSLDFMAQIDQMKTGTAIQHFGPSHLDQVTIPAASPSEQKRAVSALTKVEKASGAVRSALARQLYLLQEQRQALITAAVTGELEVPGVAA